MLALLAGSAALLVGCAKDRAASKPTLVRVPSVSSAEPQEGSALSWALIPGGTTVVAVDAELHASVTGKGIRLDDGSVLALRPLLLRVERDPSVEPPAPTSVAARMGVWMGLGANAHAERWRTQRGAAGVSGAPIIAVECIAGDAALAGTQTKGMIGTRPLEVRWLAPPAAPGATMSSVFARGIGEEASDSVWMRGALAIAEQSPLWRWRARLARGELLAGGDGGAFEDPVVESLARTIEAQWATGLGALARHDPVTARRVVERLCASVDFGNGMIVPGWPVEGPRLAWLLDSLLSQEGERAAEAATAWLEETSAILRWVEDDAAARDVTLAMAGAVGIANLTRAPMAAWATPSAPDGVPEMIAVPPWTVRRVDVSLGAPARASDRPTALAVDDALKGVRPEIRAGTAVFEPTVFSVPLPAMAPGVVIGTLHHDWTLSDWLALGQNDASSTTLGPWGSAGRVDPAWASSGLVYWGVDAPVGQGTGSPDRWLLYMELNEPRESRNGAEAGGFVRVWFGPMGRSRVVLRALPNGRVIDDSPPGIDSPRDIPRVARVAQTERGWACWIPIPGGAFEGEGLFRLGVERIDARGVRTTWPRPSLPWQHEPSRITIDGSVWQRGK